MPQDNKELSPLASYLREAFDGLKIQEISDRTGIAQPTVSRNLSGLKKPTLENMLRYAVELGVDVAQLHELAGDVEIASLYHRFPRAAKPGGEPKGYRPRDAKLHERMQRLIELGEADNVGDALKGLESTWRRLEVAFEMLAKEAGAPAALLVRNQDQVIFSWRTTSPKAVLLIQKRGQVKGWKSYSHAGEGGRLVLFFYQPQRNIKKQIETALGFWASFTIAES